MFNHLILLFFFFILYLYLITSLSNYQIQLTCIMFSGDNYILPISLQTHTFDTLGVHEIAVNFSNDYGHVETALSIIVVSKDIHNVTASAAKTALLKWESTQIHFTILTSTRYFTYVEIDQGDGSSVRKLSAVDPLIANMDQLLK